MEGPPTIQPQVTASPIRASIAKGRPSVVPTTPTQPPSGGPQAQAVGFEIQWPVVILYFIIIVVLGSALIYSLSLGKDYVTFSSSIITAITTIAGFAVGANVAPK